MVTLKANLVFDYRKADLYAGYESASFIPDDSNPSSMFYVYPSASTAITVTGRNFVYNDDDIPISGTTKAATLFVYSPQGEYIPAYSLSKFSITIEKAGEYIFQTPSKVLSDIFSGNDDISGSRFADHINGFEGKDDLFGGKGADTFYFTYRETNKKFDTIEDFKHDKDHIAIDDAFFSGLSQQNLNDTFHDVTNDRIERDDRLLYNSDTGILKYDRDGSGSARAVKIALFEDANDRHPTIDAGDILIV